jgi:hypothetical protein
MEKMYIPYDFCWCWHVKITIYIKKKMHLLTIAVFQMTIKHYLYLKIPHNLSELQKHGYLIYTLDVDMFL